MVFIQMKLRDNKRLMTENKYILISIFLKFSSSNLNI